MCGDTLVQMWKAILTLNWLSILFAKPLPPPDPHPHPHPHTTPILRPWLAPCSAHQGRRAPISWPVKEYWSMGVTNPPIIKQSHLWTPEPATSGRGPLNRAQWIWRRISKPRSPGPKAGLSQDSHTEGCGGNGCGPPVEASVLIPSNPITWMLILVSRWADHPRRDAAS